MEMSTVITEPAADVVLMGVGVVSGTIAAELTMAGYKVAGITRGPYWNYATDFASTKYDEWGIQWERKFDVPASWGSQTIRNNSTQFALPVRRATFPIQYHNFGLGVGGAAHHYGGAMGRNSPWGFSMASMTASRYGAGFLASINPFDDSEDWPMTYAEYEPYYTAWEQNFGLSGNTAGSNGNGEAIGSNAGGPAIPMSKNYPLPGHPDTPLGTLFKESTEALGYNPFPSTSSLASEPYVNPYGVQINGCVYEGWCTGGGCNFACETGAKGNSAFRSVPAAVKTGKFTLSLNSEVFRMDTDSTTGLVTAVRYYDASGNIHVQPGTAFFNGLHGGNQVRAMLISGVGVPYNSTTVTGTVGRGYTNGYLPFTGTAGPGGSIAGLGLNAISGNGGGGYTLYEFMDDGFDHTGLSFIGGSEQNAGGYSGSGPTNVSTAGGASAGSQGSAYKATLKNRYTTGGTAAHVGFGGMAPDLPNTMNMWDLDPHYNDIWGDPLPRITHEWTPNPYQAASYFASNVGNVAFLAILNKMGATNITKGGTTVVPPYAAHNDWWGHHIRGGNRVGSSSSSSTYNKYQQAWTTANLFSAGEACNTTGDTVPSGTHQAGMQSEVASEGIQMYLKNPGLLA
jgi:gluconate 2-dehydrogenase alpha chain